MTLREQTRLHHHRSGWQLIELSMVLAVLAMISVASTKAIVALMSIENRSGQALQDSEVLARLGQSWRSDLHQSASAVLSGAGDAIELAKPGGESVTYRIKGRELTREEPIPARRAPARESFAASARAWRFETLEEGRLYAIVRESAPLNLSGRGDGASPPVVDRIEGALATIEWPKTAAARGAAP